MTEELKHKLYTPTDCIPEQTMFDYIDNKLSPKEQHAVEKHMLDCELCADAMEGLRMVKDRNRIAVISQKISARMAAPADKKGSGMNYRIIMSIAAGLVLLIGSVFFFDFYITNKEADVAELKQVSDEESYAKNKNIETEASPAVPLEDNPPPPTVSETHATTDKANSVAENERTAEDLAQQLNTKDDLSKPQAPVSEISSGNGTTVAGDVTTVAEPENRTEYAFSINKNQESADDAKQDNTIENAKDLGEVSEQADKKSVVATGANSKYYVKEKQAESGKADKKPGVKKEERKREKGRNDQEDLETETTNTIAYAPREVSKEDKVDRAAADTIRALFGDNNALLKTNVDEQPKYPGGETEMQKFIAKNFQYNASEFKNDEIKSTKIFVEFTVDKTGLIKNAKIKKGVNPALDKEAIRVVNAMPKWVPAVTNGKAVDAIFILPMQIELK